MEPNLSKIAKATTKSEDQSTGASSLKEGSTKIVTAKGTIHEEAKVDIQSNAQGAYKATLQALGATKILKIVSSRENFEESPKQEKTTSKNPPTKNKIEANRIFSTVVDTP